MRCEIGDRAAIVGGLRDNIGHLVDVQRESTNTPASWVVKLLGSCLVTADGELRLAGAGTLCVIRDANLWPLRTLPGLDETIYFAGLPQDKRGDHG